MEHYDVVAIGSGFATSFFLAEYLRRAPASARLLVIERGPRIPHETRIERRMLPEWAGENVVRRAGDLGKQWTFTMGFGGSSNCWWGCTPRMLPADFRLRSLHGVGRDWPIDYDTLEPFYAEAEEIMQISGPDDGGPSPRSRPYPQPPHRFADADRLLKAKYPKLFFPQPTARARIGTGTRAPCCGNAVCHLCPVNAKFTIENGLPELHADPRVTLVTETQALDLDISGATARSVRVRRPDGREERLGADLVLLGANAIFNPFLMLRSGMEGHMIGRGLTEQASVRVDIDLRGVENFQGSTSITGNGWMFYDGEHRATRAACLVESWNAPDFRLEPGRWRERLNLKFIAEDLPQERNRVEVDPLQPDRPLATFHGHHDYALAALVRAPEMAAEMMDGLPVERIHPPRALAVTEGHVQCTTMMGTDPADSVVDAGLVSHRVRNLVVLGASVFPTASPANPTLTIAALSLYAARRLG
jgi:choline dehydrogenase-like flavoprotein